MGIHGESAVWEPEQILLTSPSDKKAAEAVKLGRPFGQALLK